MLIFTYKYKLTLISYNYLEISFKVQVSSDGLEEHPAGTAKALQTTASQHSKPQHLGGMGLGGHVNPQELRNPLTAEARASE